MRLGPRSRPRRPKRGLFPAASPNWIANCWRSKQGSPKGAPIGCANLRGMLPATFCWSADTPPEKKADARRFPSIDRDSTSIHRIADGTKQHLVREGLLEDYLDTKLGGAPFHRGVGGRRNHDDGRYLPSAVLQLADQFKAVQFRHLVIDNQARGRRIVPQEIGPALIGLYLEAVGLEQKPRRVTDGFIVVDDDDR